MPDLGRPGYGWRKIWCWVTDHDYSLIDFPHSECRRCHKVIIDRMHFLLANKLESLTGRMEIWGLTVKGEPQPAEPCPHCGTEDYCYFRR